MPDVHGGPPLVARAERVWTRVGIDSGPRGDRIRGDHETRDLYGMEIWGMEIGAVEIGLRFNVAFGSMVPSARDWVS